tara:strand:+ start:107 stop:1279 length:1173 start_codon:yes stop_codon:yes gene_type:complete
MTTKIPVELSSTPGIVDGSNATAITIDSSENVGIGETSPLAKLHIKLGDSGLSSLNAAGNHIFLENTGSNGTGITLASGNTSNGSIIFGDEDSNYRGVLIYDHSADSMKFVTAATERMRIDSSGNLGLGTASPVSLFHMQDDSSGAYVSHIVDNTNAGGYANTVYRCGTAYAGINYAPGIFFAIGPHTNDTTTPITFRNNNATERMRIAADGSMYFHKTAHAFATSGVEFLVSNLTNMTNASNTVVNMHRTGSHGVILEFWKDSGSVGSISTNANSLPSDRNFKKNIGDLDLGLNLVTKLKPSQYNYKIDSEDCPKMYGLIAQDLEESLAEVGVEKNSTWLLQHEPNDDEKQSDYSLDYLKLTPVLIKAIQEQQTQIEALQSEINTLKGE